MCLYVDVFGGGTSVYVVVAGSLGFSLSCFVCGGGEGLGSVWTMSCFEEGVGFWSLEEAVCGTGESYEAGVWGII